MGKFKDISAGFENGLGLFVQAGVDGMGFQ
jgi:hypothetical protein